MRGFGRRQWLWGCAVASLGCHQSGGPPSAPASEPTDDRDAAGRRADFDQLAAFVQAQYCFFGDKAIDWPAAVAHWRARAEDARDEIAFVHALEGLLDELYDPHCMLSTHAAGSWRPVPFDVWPTWYDDRAIVGAVRRGSSAAAAGLRPGDELRTIDGRPIADVARQRLPTARRDEDRAMRQWALLSAATGRHGDARRVEVRRSDGTTAALTLGRTLDDGPAVTHADLGDGMGLVRIGSFADPAAVQAVDDALEALRDSAGLVIDVRANGGGDTAVARPIMARFLAERSRYAEMARREGDALGARWAEYVQPRGPWTYTRPVVVEVDRFSVSMAEGFAIGMHGTGRARVVGTAMAGLGAAIGRVQLANCNIAAQISTEPVYHVDGTPRWKWMPDVPVDPLASRDPGPDGGDDPIRARARQVLAEEIARAAR